MITLTKSVLEDVVSFKSAKVRYDKHPLTFVRGVNLDSDIANPTSNGVGKSLLFSCVPNIFYQAAPASSKKNSKKDLLKKKTSNVVSFSIASGDKYEITQTAKRYVIKENGKDLKFSRIPDAEKFIRRLMPVTELDYYTYCFVSTQRPYAMQVATDVARLECLTQLFRLDSYDLMRQYFNKKLLDLKTNEVKLSILEKNLLEGKEKVQRAKDILYKNPSKESLQEKLDQYSIELQGITKQVHVLEQDALLIATLEKLNRKLNSLYDEWEYKKPPVDMLSLLSTGKKQRIVYDRFLADKKSWEAHRKKIKQKLDEAEKLRPPFSLKNLKKEVAFCSDEIEKLEVKLDKILNEKKRLLVKVQEVTEQEDLFKSFNISLKDIKSFSTDELAQVKIMVSLHETLCNTKVEGNNCPICFSKVSFKDVERATKNAVKKLPALIRISKAKKEHLKLLEMRKGLPADSEETLKKLSSTLDKLKSGVRTSDKKRQVATESISVLKKIDDLKNQLVELDRDHKPKDVEKPDLKLSLEEIEDRIDLCKVILSKEEARDSILQNHPNIKSKSKDNAKQLQTMVTTQKELRKKVATVSETLNKVSYLTRDLEHHSSSVAEIKKEINVIKPTVVDRKVYESLVKAYSTKGLKTKAAAKICTLIEANLNMYRHLVFAEPFTFTVNVSSSGISILVDRGNGHSSDVRLLSGAESNSFVLLFLLSVLVLIPAERRVSLLVLDEPCSHQDEVSREIFLTKYLPAVQVLVPNVFVITPHQTDYVKGSALWTVIKENGISTITVS